MRFLLGLSAVLLVAACSGASSSELFSGDPVTGGSAATEPEPQDEAGSTASTPPAEKKDASPTVDAGVDASTKDAAKEASAPKCSFDSECEDGELCNWKTDTCSAPGALGAACKRDVECSDGLCNWKLETCSEPAPSGSACRRNKECVSDACWSGKCK